MPMWALSWAWLMVAIGAVAFVVYLTLQIKSCVEPKAAQQGRAVQPPPGMKGPDVVNRPISENSSRIPDPKKRAGGILKARHTDPITGKKDSLEILIPADPRSDEPWSWLFEGKQDSTSPAPSNWQVEWTPVRAPWFEFELSGLGGVSVDLDKDLLPYLELGVVRILDRVNLGVALDPAGLGGAGGYEIATHLDLGVSWRFLTGKQGTSRAALHLAYRF